MTETEVKKLEEFVLSGDEMLGVEKAWLDEQVGRLSREEARLKAAFRMWKFVRNDEKMILAAKEVGEIRKLLEYCSNRIDEMCLDEMAKLKP